VLHKIPDNGSGSINMARWLDTFFCVVMQHRKHIIYGTVGCARNKSW